MSPLCRHGKEVVKVSGTLDHWRHRDSAFFCDPTVGVEPSVSEPARCPPDPNCGFCEGTGSVDSGGFTPWDTPIDVACACTYAKPVIAPQSTPEPCHVCGGTEQFEGFCANCPGPRCKNCGDVKRGHKLRDGKEMCCPKVTYFEPVEAAPQGVGKLSPEPPCLVGKFDDGGFRYSLGPCPRCKQELLLWFEQFKGGGTVIARVYHRGGNNHCKENK